MIVVPPLDVQEDQAKDIRFINKIRQNIHLMYEQGNLETPTNSQSSPSYMNNQCSISHHEESKIAADNNRSNVVSQPSAPVETILNQDSSSLQSDDSMGFGAMAVKAASIGKQSKKSQWGR